MKYIPWQEQSSVNVNKTEEDKAFEGKKAQSIENHEEVVNSTKIEESNEKIAQTSKMSDVEIIVNIQ